jgi:hypothetical protein
MIITNSFMKSNGIGLQAFLSLFIGSVFITAGILSSPTGVLVSVGIAVESGDLWERFLLLMSLIMLEVSAALVNRWDRGIDLVGGVSKKSKFWQSVIGIFKSSEMTLSLILVIIISTCAIQNEASAVFVGYAFLGIIMMWRARRAISIFLCCLCLCVVASIILFASWYPYAAEDPTLKPEWMSNLGIPFPTPTHVFTECLPHLLVISVTSFYLRSSHIDLSDSVKMVNRWYYMYPRLLSWVGVMVPIIISLVLFVSMPFDYFSGFVLLCFAMQMGFLM